MLFRADTFSNIPIILKYHIRKNCVDYIRVTPTFICSKNQSIQNISIFVVWMKKSYYIEK